MILLYYICHKFQAFLPQIYSVYVLVIFMLRFLKLLVFKSTFLLQID